MSAAALSKRDLPDGWTVARLRDVTDVVRNIHPESEPSREFRYVDISSICNATNRILDRKTFLGREAPSRARRPIQPHDVLFSNVRTYLRNVAIVPPDLNVDLCSTGFAVLRSNGAIDPQFLFRYLLTDRFIDGVTAKQRGAHYPATTDRVVLDETIPLPPLKEQGRIAGRVNSLLSQVQEVQRALDCVSESLRRFRESILVAACSGRLTEQWTGHQRSNSVEALLHQIASEHETGSPRGALEKSIPEGWRRVTLGFLTQSTLRSKPYITSGSRGWAKYTSTRGHYFIRSENINTDYLRLSDAVRVEPPSSSETQRTEVRPGDLLLTITGNNVGRTAVVPSDCPRAFVSQHVAIIRLHERIVPEYVWIWMRSRKHGFAQLEESSYGETKPGLNLEQLKSVWVDLPPVAEQREIVRRVEALFQLADGIERCVSAARLRADGLRQAILTRAFRGELVPTEADLARTEGRDYETADQLLARVREEAKNSPAPTRKKGRPAMQKRKLDRPTVEEAVRSMPRDRFEFDELLAEFPADYEPLKEILFKLLDDSASGLTQVFDEESRAMQFERRGK